MGNRSLEPHKMTTGKSHTPSVEWTNRAPKLNQLRIYVLLEPLLTFANELAETVQANGGLNVVVGLSDTPEEPKLSCPWRRDMRVLAFIWRTFTPDV